ncbi:hypothetical protein HZS_5990 [Henneguya salminicola]|nr:hypothetical protein HZS_5990 [Henneguya salminicola]
MYFTIIWYKDLFVILMDRTDENKTNIIFPQMYYTHYNIDNRYNYCSSSTESCINVRIILTKIYSQTCITLYEVKLKSKLIAIKRENKIILGHKTYKEQFPTNKTIYFNKYMKNKGKFIHNSTFAFILGYIDQTMILNKIQSKLVKKSYSRINGYWCQNPIKTNPQVIDNGNTIFCVPDFTVISFLSITILIISKYLLNYQ